MRSGQIRACTFSAPEVMRSSTQLEWPLPAAAISAVPPKVLRPSSRGLPGSLREGRGLAGVRVGGVEVGLGPVQPPQHLQLPRECRVAHRRTCRARAEPRLSGITKARARAQQPKQTSNAGAVRGALGRSHIRRHPWSSG